MHINDYEIFMMITGLDMVMWMDRCSEYHVSHKTIYLDFLVLGFKFST